MTVLWKNSVSHDNSYMPVVVIHSRSCSFWQKPTIWLGSVLTTFNAETAGVFQLFYLVCTGGLSFPGVSKGRSCSFYQPTGCFKVITFHSIKVSTKTYWKRRYKFYLIITQSHSERSKGKGQLVTNIRNRTSYRWLFHLITNAYYKYSGFRSPILNLYLLRRIAFMKISLPQETTALTCIFSDNIKPTKCTKTKMLLWIVKH